MVNTYSTSLSYSSHRGDTTRTALVFLFTISLACSAFSHPARSLHLVCCCSHQCLFARLTLVGQRASSWINPIYHVGRKHFCLYPDNLHFSDPNSHCSDHTPCAPNYLVSG